MIVGCLATLARRLFFQSLSTEKQEGMKRRGERRNRETECNVESKTSKGGSFISKERRKRNLRKEKWGEDWRLSSEMSSDEGKMERSKG